MDDDRVEGTARNVGGKVQEGWGKVTGNAQTQAEGLANQAAGAAQDLYGQAADAATGFEKVLRRTRNTTLYQRDSRPWDRMAAWSHASPNLSSTVRRQTSYAPFVTRHESDLLGYWRH
jgi:uncharacterized protein YjbJ (UPF0337 family)